MCSSSNRTCGCRGAVESISTQKVVHDVMQGFGIGSKPARHLCTDSLSAAGRQEGSRAVPNTAAVTSLADMLYTLSSHARTSVGGADPVAASLFAMTLPDESRSSELSCPACPSAANSLAMQVTSAVGC